MAGTAAARQPYDQAMSLERRRVRRHRPLGALVVAVLVASCGASASASPSTAPASSLGASPGSASPSAPASASSSTSARAAVSGDPTRARAELAVVAKGLVAPLAVVAPDDGTGRLFVVEQAGRIRIVTDGRVLERPFLDIAGRVSSGGERGLLGLAFEPAFGTAGANRLFVNYTDTNGNTVIAEYRVSSADRDVADPTSERAILRIAQPFANHNGGGLVFGPDRMLYAGLGDGGSGGDPMNNGQRLDTRLGKLLRLDVLGVAGTTLAPSDNPFVGTPGAKPEIWAFGLRNPWRFSFDHATGDLWIGDVGQNAYEEVDRARAAEGRGRGLNFGWNRMEGSHCYPSGDSCNRTGLTLPVTEYGHDQGCAVVGGVVDRAPDAGALAGVYLFSDNCSGRVWGIASAAAGPVPPVELNRGGRSISAFGEGSDGTVYATDLASGDLLRVAAAPR
jgi:glucose/arabinose dehydrogenase